MRVTPSFVSPSSFFQDIFRKAFWQGSNLIGPSLSTIFGATDLPVSVHGFGFFEEKRREWLQYTLYQKHFLLASLKNWS